MDIVYRVICKKCGLPDIAFEPEEKNVSEPEEKNVRLLKLSRTQKLASLVEGRMADNRYIVNKREENQPRFFKCSCCGKEFDFNKSADYVGAIHQWQENGGKCYACANMLGTKESFPCHFK